MKLNQTYIDAYERSYKRTKATFIIMYAIIYVAFVLNPSIAEQVFTIYINCYLISFIALLAWTMYIPVEQHASSEGTARHSASNCTSAANVLF